MINHAERISLTSTPEKTHLTATLINGLFCVLVALICGNALLYSLAAATPLIQADGWYFLESFLSRYFDGTLGVLDLFMQRGGTDHAQPLQKLVLLFHTRYFDMDFRVEGFIGVLFGILWCTIIARELRSTSNALTGQRIAAGLGIVLVFALGLSLNSSNIFTWPLVTLGYIALLLSTAYFLFVLKGWGRSHPLPILLATTALGLCIDSQAIVALIAMLLALTPLQAPNRRTAKLQAAAAAAGLVIARLCLWLIARHADVPGSSGPSSRSFLSMLSEPGVISGLLTPFSDSLIHVEHLVRLYPDDHSRVMAVCAAVVAALHLWFWARIFRAIRRAQYGNSAALAVFLMLSGYGLTAAIIIGRVPMFDWNYLHQPRYVMTYQVTLVAIAVMLQDALRTAPITSVKGKLAVSLIVSVVAALLFVQVPLSRQAWGLPHYLTPYWQNAALVMQRVAQAPKAAVGQCPDIMTVCEYSPERREQLMRMLVDHQLNVFSPNFQMRNRIYPELSTIPGFNNAEVAQPLDEEIRKPESLATLSIDHESQCLTGDSPIDAIITIKAHTAAGNGMQLWIETIGGSRQLLETIDANDAQFNKSIPNRSHLTLLRNGDNRVLAQADLELTTCPVATP